MCSCLHVLSCQTPSRLQARLNKAVHEKPEGLPPLQHVLVLQIVSTMGTTRLEDVAEASKGSPLLIFQLYVQRDREFTASLLRSKHLQFL